MRCYWNFSEAKSDKKQKDFYSIGHMYQVRTSSYPALPALVG